VVARLAGMNTPPSSSSSQHIRVEVRERGTLVCSAEFPAPEDMDDEEAAAWAKHHTVMRTAYGKEWSLRVIPADRYAVPTLHDWPAR
jgi:hypothetical protein